jgi:hypothetical protein
LLFSMMVRPTDVGLTKRLGAMDPSWAAMFVVLQDGEIIFNDCIYAVWRTDQRLQFEVVRNSGRPVNNAELCRFWFDWLMQPKIGIMLDNYDAVEDGTPLMMATIDRVPIWRHDVYVKSQFCTYQNIEIALRDRERVERALVAAGAHYYMSEIDRCLTINRGFRDGALYRMPRIVELYVEFYLVATDRLPPYVVLWIFDWLPGYLLHSERFKIRWLEQIYHCIRLLRLRRRERPATRSAKRRLEGAPSDTNKR